MHLSIRGNSCRFFFDISPFHIFIATILVYAILSISYAEAIKSFRFPIVFISASGGLMLLIGMWMTVNDKPIYDLKHYTNHYDPGGPLKIEIIEELKHSDYYYKYLGRIISAGNVNTRGKVLLRLIRTDSLSPLGYDEILWSSQQLTEFREAVNPGGFDAKNFYGRKGMFHQLTLQPGQFTRSPSGRVSMRGRAMQLREHLVKSLESQKFYKREFEVIKALLLGHKRGLSKETILDYRNAGALHILAISGLHIGIWLLILQFLLKPLERLKAGRSIKWGILLFCLWSFVLLSGMSASVIRAVGMVTFLSIGIFLGRRGNTSYFLFSSLFFSLLVRPLNMFDLGFQLSYTAVLAILMIAPQLKKFWKPKNNLVRYFWNLSVISFSAQLGVLPLTLYHFHYFSAVFFLSGMLIIPGLGVILGLGFLMIVLDQLGLLPEFYVQLYNGLVRLMNWLIQAIGDLNPLFLHQVNFSLTLFAASYILIFSFVHVLVSRSTKGWNIFILSLIVFYTVLIIEKGAAGSHESLTVFDSYKKSIVLRHVGTKGYVYAGGENEDSVSRILNNYRVKHGSPEIILYKERPNFFKAIDKKVMVLDTCSFLNDPGFQPDILILVNSPSVNLERLLYMMKPTTIVADGSNYTSFKARWQKTALKFGVTYHDTSKHGAFTVKNR